MQLSCNIRNIMYINCMNAQDIAQYIKQQIDKESKRKCCFDSDEYISLGRIAALEALADHFNININETNELQHPQHHA